MSNTDTITTIQSPSPPVLTDGVAITKASKTRSAKTLKAPKTKQEQLVTLMRRRQGATIGEMTSATGWQAHSVRGAISGTLKKKLGLAVISETVAGRGRIYRLHTEA